MKNIGEGRSTGRKNIKDLSCAILEHVHDTLTHMRTNFALCRCTVRPISRTKIDEVKVKKRAVAVSTEYSVECVCHRYPYPHHARQAFDTGHNMMLYSDLYSECRIYHSNDVQYLGLVSTVGPSGPVSYLLLSVSSWTIGSLRSNHGYKRAGGDRPEPSMVELAMQRATWTRDNHLRPRELLLQHHKKAPIRLQRNQLV